MSGELLLSKGDSYGAWLLVSESSRLSISVDGNGKQPTDWLIARGGLEKGGEPDSQV